jgi:hypothetical protein
MVTGGDAATVGSKGWMDGHSSGKRMKRRYKIKNRASQVIGRVALAWLHSAPNGPMFKRGWRELDLKE